MRDIRFRAWDKETKEMIYINPYSSNNYMMTWDGLVYDDGILLNYILMQYTGLKDKNGKEIYEGDIVSTDTTKVIIKWNESNLSYSCERIGKNEFFHQIFPLHYAKCGMYKVIGNLHENPELLKVKG